MSPEAIPPPSGAVQFAWFGGILEGHATDLELLGSTVQEINSLGMMFADLDVERGRFSLLFDDKVVTGPSMDRVKSERLVELLDRVVGLTSSPQQLESTLNCTEVYRDGVVETLFAVRDGAIEGVSRQRDVRSEDLTRGKVGGAGPRIALPNMSRPMVLLLLVLFLTAGGLMAWRRGLLDQINAAKVETIQVDLASFQGLIQLQVEEVWGIYAVAVSRGPEYPTTTEQADALEGRATTTVEKAAIRAVVGGTGMFVQLLDGDGKVLEAKPASLARLLSEDKPVVVKLRGRARAKSIRLSLDSGSSKP